MDQPGNEIIEVSLIGTGGGYGESIVIHLGLNNWIVIDSCIDPYTKECLPLKYLESIGVSIHTDVKLIVCTHWHDDHILGISKLFEKCLNAEFSVAYSLDPKKFCQFVNIDYEKVTINHASISSTKEMAGCLEIIKKRNLTIKGSVKDRRLFNNNANNIHQEIWSLSPSDFVIEEFYNELTLLMNDYQKKNRKIVIHSPNDKSVVIYIKINHHRILLGSDLEYTNDARKGWLNILGGTTAIDNAASLFKIPHHGSKNAYSEDIFKNLVGHEALLKLSPWNSGRNKLPTNDMINKYKTHSPDLHITSNPNSRNKPKERKRTIAKAIEEINSTLVEMKYSFGMVRSRKNIFDEESTPWQISHFGGAYKL